jgi:hypothetical protein
VVAAHADVGAGVELGAALAHDDRTGRHVWPPNTFTPSIFGFESRPLRVEPPPFFCAMVQCSFRPATFTEAICSSV